MALERLDKFLSNEGLGTRTQVKTLIRNKRVRVNNVIVSDPSMKILVDADEIVCDGKTLKKTGLRYFMLHKPAGCISATIDAKQKTVLDLIGDAGKGISPAGRLDIDTEGLLLLTDDGLMIHELLSPRKHVDKTYLALVDHTIPAGLIGQFKNGMDIGDEKLTLPAILQVFSKEEVQGLVKENFLPAKVSIYQTEQGTGDAPEEKSGATQMVDSVRAPGDWASVTIHEGRFHQIKRMFKAAGLNVVYLKRISMGPLHLDTSLAPGAFRELTEKEIAALKNVKMKAMQNSI